MATFFSSSHLRFHSLFLPYSVIFPFPKNVNFSPLFTLLTFIFLSFISISQILFSRSSKKGKIRSSPAEISYAKSLIQENTILP